MEVCGDTKLAISLISALVIVSGSLLLFYNMMYGTPHKQYCTNLGDQITSEGVQNEYKLKIIDNYTKICTTDE
jgi:hypothetical protein